MTDRQDSLAGIQRGIRRQLLIGGLAMLVIVVGLGGMAATIDFAGALVAEGRLVVDSNVKNVQHPAGGTVTEIAVKDGDRVRAGDLLLRLDSTTAAANLAIVTKGLDELAVRKARLEAERNGAAAISFPSEILARANETVVADLILTEQAQFGSRRAARESEKEQLRKKIVELQHQLEGIAAQQDAIKRQAAVTGGELKGLRMLAGKNLVPVDRVSAVERQAAQYDGQLGQLLANAGQTGAEIAQAELQILKVDQDMETDVAGQLSDDGSKFNELWERKIAAEDQLRRLEIRATQDGIVYQLAVHTIGGVVGAGDVIMQIVPENDALVVEARVNPAEVDRVHPGSAAGLRFTNFGSWTTPEFEGTVETVSPDIVVDQKSGTGYYIARIRLPAATVKQLGRPIVAGMPVEVFIATGERTALAYLVKPLSDQIARSFRER
jgi:HlyD family secretion protein